MGSYEISTTLSTLKDHEALKKLFPKEKMDEIKEINDKADVVA